MHDLNVINRMNLEAFASSIAGFRASGRHVLAKYEGAHLVAIETFTEPMLALEAWEVANAAQHGGERNVLYAPTQAAAPAQTGKLRDQSEDRAQPYSLEALALLGRTGEHTLADYIARKEGSTGGVPVLPANEN